MTLYRDPREYPQPVLRGTQPKRREDSRLNTILIVAVLMAGELFVAWCWFR